jgi:hypothetical protein
MLSVGSMAGPGSIWEWIKATISLRSIARDFIFKQYRGSSTWSCWLYSRVTFHMFK